jgi:hypothetical protein
MNEFCHQCPLRARHTVRNVSLFLNNPEFHPRTRARDNVDKSLIKQIAKAHCSNASVPRLTQDSQRCCVVA